MNKKTNKYGITITIIITVVILALLNVCTFVIPFNKVDTITHYVTYGCAEFVILVEMFLVITELFGNEDDNQKIISLPMIHYGLIITIVQLIATLIAYISNAFISFPLWIVIVIECFILGIGLIQVCKGFFFKAHNYDYHNNVANTKFMDTFRGQLKVIVKINDNENIKKELNDLLDTALGSDPITNDKTIESEDTLSILVDSLNESIKHGNEETSRELIKNLKNTLVERNVLCKTGK